MNYCNYIIKYIKNMYKNFYDFYIHFNELCKQYVEEEYFKI